MADRVNDEWVDVPVDSDWVDVPTDTGSDWVDVPDQEPQGDFAEQMTGRVSKGFMTLGRALTGAPAHVVRQAGLIGQWAQAEDVLREQDSQRQAQLLKNMSKSKQAFDATAKALGEASDWQKQGAKTIIRNHPEWRSNPPESFIELLKNPRETVLAITEALPLLISAGIMTAAGQPNIATAMMYTSEGQNMADQVIADGGTQEEADIAYVIYGLPAAAMEKMQLDRFIKVAKGSYNALFNRVVQKTAQRGLRTATYETMKVGVTEAVQEMAQGEWGEITAKMVYDKDIPGGLWGTIDRRAQEAYLGFIMGLIPGVAGGVAGRVAGGRAVAEAPVAEEPVMEGGGEVLSPIQIKPERDPYGGYSINRTQGGLPKIKPGYVRVFRGESPERLKTSPADIEQFGVEDVGKGGWFTTDLDFAMRFFKGKRDATLVYMDITKEQAKAHFLRETSYPAEGIGIEMEGIVDPDTLLAQEYFFPELRTPAVAKAAPVVAVEPEPGAVALVEAPTEAPTVGDPITKTEKNQLRKQGHSLSDILKMNPTEARSILGIEEVQAPPKPKHITRKKALALGHSLPETLEWDEAQRRDFMQQTVGATTMKGMKLADMRTLIEALQGEVRAAGLEYTPETPPIDELVETLQTKKVTELEPTEELRAGKVRQLGHRIKAETYSFVVGLERMERFFESLDRHKKGAFTENIWKPVQQADELSTENANQDFDEFQGYLKEQDVDTALWLGKMEDIGRWSLTPFQKIGTYMLAQNKNGRRQLTQGMGMSEVDLAQIMEAMTPQETAVADWLLEKYDQQWEVIKVVAVQSSMDPTKLKKELHYSPIMRTDADLETQEDFLSGLSDAFTGEKYNPERKFLEPRKRGARGKVELDAAILYMHNIARTQRFLQMAPVAHKIGRILNNKKFKQALNERTYGQGSKLVNKWMKDAVRGTVSQNTTALSKMANIMRRNGIVYAIGYNIPSSSRQSLSLSNAVAVDKAMLAHVPANLARATTPKGYKEMEEFVFSRSLQVKNSSFDRDLRTKANKAGLKLKLRGKRQWSQKAISWIRWMDRHTRVVAWKSLYDTGIGKFNDEIKASEYADKWVARTQPMANTKDLPHFFRGGTFEKLLTTFQNQVNNNANFYMYDILGAKKAGEISLTEAGHRVMFSYVLPAILFGMIGRGGLPKDIKDIVVDLATYPIAGVVVIGRWITAMIRGWGSSSTIAEIGPEEAGKLIGAVKRGDLQDIIKHAATTVGAVTGRIPAQAVRTAEGVIDIAAGETQDPRRLIYSEWALAQGKKKKKKIKYGGGYILP